MEPIRQHQEAFTVAGLRVRTTNAGERNPATMRIGGLWQRFFAAEVYARTPHIWQYFEAHPQIRRSYRSDFEAYTSPTDLTVHIGIESNRP